MIDEIEAYIGLRKECVVYKSEAIKYYIKIQHEL